MSSAHVQSGDLDAALPAAHQSVDVLARVASRRAQDYLDDLATRLAPWRAQLQVGELLRRIHPGEHRWVPA